MEPTQYDILRRQDSSAIWLETSPDLLAAKTRIKKIVSFWPGKYDVVDHQSQRIVASISTPVNLPAYFKRMRGTAAKSLWTIYESLSAPLPRVAGLLPRLRILRSWYWSTCEWLWAPMAPEQANRSR